MTDNTTITPEQLRTVLVATELGGKAGDSKHFSYAELGNSTYSFGQMQFDVGGNPAAQSFLKDNGFDASEIDMLSQHGGLSSKDKAVLDTKLQAIPQAKMDQFTNQQLNDTIGRVGDIINDVSKQNPAAAEAISKDQKLQLGIADYANQFSPRLDNQLAAFLAGKPERGIHAGSPPTRDDMQNFIDTTPYGHNPANAKAVKGRAERFDEAMGTLKLAPAAKAPNHTSDKSNTTLEQGAHGQAVHDLQSRLAGLGYLDSKGVDGDFGVHTRQAVERFQRDHHLTMDGKVGSLTQQAMHTALPQRATAHDLGDPESPDHVLFAQALAGVRTLDAHGQPTELQHLNLAAALVVEAKHQGFERIDQVALGDDGSRVYIAQHPASPLETMKLDSVDTVAALHTPIAQSAAAAAALPSPAVAPSAPVVHAPATAQTFAI